MSEIWLQTTFFCQNSMFIKKSIEHNIELNTHIAFIWACFSRQSNVLELVKMIIEFSIDLNMDLNKMNSGMDH